MTQLLERAIAEAAKLPDEKQNAVALRILAELQATQFADLEEGYRQMAADEARESEAVEWAEATIGDVCDETR